MISLKYVLAACVIIICDLAHCDHCGASKSDGTNSIDSCQTKKKFIFYDVHEAEGFNLKRDVFMRMATLVNQLGTDWSLVLPPWCSNVHWKNLKNQEQIRIPWQTFFDLTSIRKAVPIIELLDFMDNHGSTIDLILSLHHNENTFKNEETFRNWHEHVEIKECKKSKSYYTDVDLKVRGKFWSFDKSMEANRLICVKIEGYVSTLENLIVSNFSHINSIMILNAEIILHDNYGSPEFWRIRRSMRFNQHLVNLANVFREAYLNSNNIKDKTIEETDWRKQRKYEKDEAIGGPYLSVHLRQADFARYRRKNVPDMDSAAQQIKFVLKSNDALNNTVFVATDTVMKDWLRLKYLLEKSGIKVNRYENEDLLDGEVAIIDQLICAHAMFFIGTHESTFSFRIQEEREILGFNSKTTFNAFCGEWPTKSTKLCQQMSTWKIVY